MAGKRFDDDELQLVLREALDEELPLGEEVIDDAIAMFTWRTVDAELGELLADSAVDSLAGVRADELHTRHLRFSLGEYIVSADLSHDGVLVLSVEPHADDLVIVLERTDRRGVALNPIELQPVAGAGLFHATVAGTYRFRVRISRRDPPIATVSPWVDEPG